MRELSLWSEEVALCVQGEQTPFLWRRRYMFKENPHYTSMKTSLPCHPGTQYSSRIQLWDSALPGPLCLALIATRRPQRCRGHVEVPADPPAALAAAHQSLQPGPLSRGSSGGGRDCRGIASSSSSSRDRDGP